jgi:hypothetical protein
MLIDLIYINISILLSSFSKSIGFSLILLTLFNISILWPHLQSDGNVDIMKDSQLELFHVLKSVVEHDKHISKQHSNESIVADKEQKHEKNILKYNLAHLNNNNLNDTFEIIKEVLKEQETDVPLHQNHVEKQIAVTYYFLLFSFVGMTLCATLAFLML